MRRSLGLIMVFISVCPLFVVPTWLVDSSLESEQSTGYQSFEALDEPETRCTSEVSNVLRDDFDTFRTDLWSKSDYVGPGNTTFKPEHVNVSGGLLRLTVPEGKREGGQIESLEKYGYGRYRAKIKASAVAGTVQAFFVYKGPEPEGLNEIDIEFGLWEDRTIVTLNTWEPGEQYLENPHNHSLGFDPSADFHEYGFDWYMDRVEFYVDDDLVWTSVEHIPYEPCSIMFNNWVRGPSLPSQSSFMYVDWVTYRPERIWTVDDDGPADFHTIHEAINAASPGDTIYVYNGTYYETALVDKSLTIKSESGAEDTIVQEKNATSHVFIVTADNVNITGFTVTGHVSYVGILLLTDHCNISNNIFSNSWAGIDLSWSCNNNIRNNEFINNGIFILGNELSHFNTHMIENNSVNGKPIYYYKNVQSIKVTDSAGQVILANCSNIIMENIDQSFSSVGVELAYTKNSTIANSDFSNNRADGILLFYSNSNTITNNKISNNNDGIRLISSLNNSISGNNITNNWTGIYLQGNSSNNKICHNNIIDNYYKQVKITYQGCANLWDDGYPSGGNYWSDYTGVDVKSGPNQDQSGSDGIGDTPYVIDTDNVDNYPLRNPTYGPPSPQTYRLRITTTVGGTTNPSTGTQTYEEGTVVNVTAIPYTNYEFDYWVLDDHQNYSNPINVTMDSDHTLHAIFKYSPSPPVGGIYIPVNKLELLAPYIGLTSTILIATAATAIYIKRIKGRKKQ